MTCVVLFIRSVDYMAGQDKTTTRMRRVDDNDDADRLRLSVHVEPRALADLFSTFRRT